MKNLKSNLLKVGCLFVLFSINIVVPAQNRQDWILAMHGFTFRYSTFVEVLDKTKALGVDNVEVYFGQLLGEGFPEGEKIHYRTITPEIASKIKDLLKEKKMNLVSAGVVRPTDEADWRKLFTFANEFGIKVVNAEPPSAMVETFEMIDRLANEYGVNVAIHNHKAPALYWDPKIILDLVKNSHSTRIGINADLGHWVRSGLDPLECIKVSEGKIMSIHMKDIDDKFRDCVWGEGICKDASILKDLKRQNYKGIFTIEYESKSPSLDQDIEKSLSFFKKQIKVNL